jgi:hypothetical protein
MLRRIYQPSLPIVGLGVMLVSYPKLRQCAVALDVRRSVVMSRGASYEHEIMADDFESDSKIVRAGFRTSGTSISKCDLRHRNLGFLYGRRT